MGLLTRLDSIKEVVKSVGTSDDPAERRQPSGSIPLDMEELDDWLEHGRYSPHVVERPARDSIRGDFEVQVGDETPFEGRLNDLGLKYKMRDALRYARGTGGAGIVIVADDEAALSDPIHWKTFTEVKALHVFDRWELHPEDHVDNLDDEDYGEPKTYYFHPDKPGQTHDKNGDPVGDEIHHTRVIPYIGRKVRRLRRDDYDNWGQPIPDLLQETLKDLNAGTQAISSSLDEFQYDVFFIDGLREMLTGAEGGEGGGGDNGPISELFDAINAAKSYLNAVVLPGEDSSLEKRTIDYSGLIEAVGILKENLSMGSEIPLSVLFGQTPEGLSSNDETGRDNYFDHVREIREEKHNPAIERVIELLAHEKGSGFEGVPNYSIDWGPLDEPSETEQAEVESKEAKALQGDVKLGILSPREAKQKRHPELVRDRGDVSYEDLEADRRLVEDARPKDDPAVEASDLQPEKQRKEDVGYVNSSPGDEVCADCAWYDSQTGACGIVRGEIAESGWCRLWGTKALAGPAREDAEYRTDPYSGPGDESLPERVQEADEEARKKWVEVFNAVWAQHDELDDDEREERAFAIANEQVDIE